MIRPEHTQMVVHALGHMCRMSGDRRETEMGKIKLQALEKQLDSQRDMLRMRLDAKHDAMVIKAEAFKNFVHAMVECRTEAIQAGFTQVMAMYAEDQRQYAEQHAKIIDAMITCMDPIQALNYRSRAGAIEHERKRIRSDARRVYHEMARAVLLIGGSMPSLPAGDRSSLQLL